MEVRSIRQFYELMDETKKIREKIVNLYFQHERIQPELLNSLHLALRSLEGIPKSNGKYILSVTKNKNILLDITYEVEELKKDIFFVEHSQDEFYLYLEKLHDHFLEQVKEGERFLKGILFQNFIADRDGTVNNYCGRYRSSIQSIYNYIFLANFAGACTRRSIILTSAPLEDGGLINISIDPRNLFIYAGSKGREYLAQGVVKHFPIGKEEQKVLNLLNARLSELVSRSGYEIFSLIGSGLQLKFGQTTISRQDIYHSIPDEESEHFQDMVRNIVHETDPEERFLRIEDTGLDIEIILTLKNDDNIKIFDKGDGIRFLNGELNLEMEKGPNLICGDTPSDIPMVAASMEKTKNTWSIFVTRDKSLQQKVMSVCANTFFVSEPDTLVAILNNLSN